MKTLIIALALALALISPATASEKPIVYKEGNSIVWDTTPLALAKNKGDLIKAIETASKQAEELAEKGENPFGLACDVWFLMADKMADKFTK